MVTGGKLTGLTDREAVLAAMAQFRKLGRDAFIAEYSDGIACTNQAESFFSRLRRMEVGTHHRIAGPYRASYAAEASWRDDNRRVDNSGQAMMVAEATMASRV